MNQTIASAFEEQVANVIKDLGYKVTPEPSSVPHRKLWWEDPASMVRGLKYQPDFLVEHDGKFVIVETKSFPVLIAGVVQARRTGDYFGTNTVLCLPDKVFSQIPMSVREFADEQSVHICPLAEVDEVLMGLLQ